VWEGTFVVQKRFESSPVHQRLAVRVLLDTDSGLLAGRFEDGGTFDPGKLVMVSAPVLVAGCIRSAEVAQIDAATTSR